VELTDALGSLRRHWKFSVGVFLLAVVACGGFLYTRKSTRPPNKYMASVDVLIPAIDNKGVRPAGVPNSLLQGQTQLALSKETEEAALAAAKLPKKSGSVSFGFTQSSGSSADSTSGSSSGCSGASCSDVVNLSATAYGQKVATSAARAFASSYIAARRDAVQHSAVAAQQQGTASLALLKKNLDEVDNAIAQKDPAVVPRLLAGAGASPAAATAVLPVGTPEDVVLLVVQRNALLTQIASIRSDYAKQYITSLVPDAFASTLQSHSAVKLATQTPSNKVPIAAFLGVGLALALLIPILRDRLDRSIRSPKMAAEALDATVLTVLPPLSRRGSHVLAAQGSATEDAYRALAATAVATDRMPKAIVVMSPTGVLQDWVAANFAAALASLGLRVALVGTDPRQSWFANGHAEEHDLSFRQLLNLAHQGRLNGALTRGLVSTEIENLFVLPPGEANGDLGLDGLAPLLSALASNVDVSVIAGPSLLDDPNATIFAWTTRSVLWTVEAGHTTEADAKEAAARLELAGASAFGIVMVSARHV
jgi:Mrp family chromosome partitioning ATPase